MSPIRKFFALILFSSFFLLIGVKAVFAQLAPPQSQTITIIPGASNPNIPNPFFPSSPEYPLGTNVTWVNTDTVVHTVTSFTNSFDSENINQSKAWWHIFYNDGYYGYYCKQHPYMNGAVIIR